MFNSYVKHLLDVWVVGVCNLMASTLFQFGFDSTAFLILSWKENGLNFSRFSQKVQKGLPYQRVSRHLKFHIWLKYLSIPCKSLVLAKLKSLLSHPHGSSNVSWHLPTKSHRTINLFLSLPATARETTK